MSRKIVVRLKPSESDFLGLEPKPVNGNINPKYSITLAQKEAIDLLRNKGIVEATQILSVPTETMRLMWREITDDNGKKIGNGMIINPLFKAPEVLQVMDEMKTLHNLMIKDIKKYSFDYPTFKRNKSKDACCLVFDAADIHLGKICSSFETGETYNSQIAVKRVKEGLHGIIQKSRGWDIDKVIFIAGNDILHVDNAKSSTTSGTNQDTDQMWYDNFMMGKKLLVEIIETFLTIADVEVVYNPSNHDFTHGFMLLDSVSSWFNKCDQVTFDNDMRHRKYTIYGDNLIGTTHMDGAKVDKLHGLMAEEASEYWHKCRHRYFYGHHIHHKTGKDVFSVCIETLRSPSGTDGWHHRNGYQHAPKAIEGFIHHKTKGQEARLTHIF